MIALPCSAPRNKTAEHESRRQTNCRASDSERCEQRKRREGEAEESYKTLNTLMRWTGRISSERTFPEETRTCWMHLPPCWDGVDGLRVCRNVIRDIFELLNATFHNILEATTGVVISFYSTGHSRWKEVSSTKLQFKDHENPTWRWILDAVGCCFALLRRVCWPVLEECYVHTQICGNILFSFKIFYSGFLMKFIF
jgi:hypothetical protein